MTIRNGLLQGMLNGKPVNCALRPGVNIPKGVYKLLPAVQDPVFGTLILMVAVGRPGGPVMGKDQGMAVAVATLGDGIPSRAAGIAGFNAAGIAGFNAAGIAGFKGLGSTEPVFVLSAQAMPGRNNIVVNFGFSSLIEGLKPGAGEIEVV